jgi:hypothetical protein
MKYVRCDSHCKFPAYDKEEVDNLIKEVKEETPKIYYGTEEPSTDIGKDGDVYLKYE